MILYFLIQFTKLSTDTDNFIFLVYLRFSLLLFYFQIYQFVQDDFQTCLKSKGFFLTIKLPIKFLVFYYISIKKYPIISIYLKSKGFFFSFAIILLLLVLLRMSPPRVQIYNYIPMATRTRQVSEQTQTIQLYCCGFDLFVHTGMSLSLAFSF